jgi:hypothetical protein
VLGHGLSQLVGLLEHEDLHLDVLFPSLYLDVSVPVSLVLFVV